MSTRQKLTMLLLFLVLIPSCQNQNDTKEGAYIRSVTILLGCNDVEVTSDLKYSVENISAYLKQNKIKLVVDEKKNGCGYLLKDGDRINKIESALTDLDLIGELKSFFGIAS